MKTAELEGQLLDYWAARAAGWEVLPSAPPGAFCAEGNANKPWWKPPSDAKYGCGACIGYPPQFSTNWAQGGPLIQRERIELQYSGDEWRASKYDEVLDMKMMPDVSPSFGPTPLIAAMRCLVASRFGEEVPFIDKDGYERRTYATSTATDPETKKRQDAALKKSMRKLP